MFQKLLSEHFWIFLLHIFTHSQLITIMKMYLINIHYKDCCQKILVNFCYLFLNNHWIIVILQYTLVKHFVYSLNIPITSLPDFLYLFCVCVCVCVHVLTRLFTFLASILILINIYFCWIQFQKIILLLFLCFYFFINNCNWRGFFYTFDTSLLILFTIFLLYCLLLSITCSLVMFRPIQPTMCTKMAAKHQSSSSLVMPSVCNQFTEQINLNMLKLT